MSTTLFERMQVNGTNVIAQNGIAAGQKIAHFAINVIPRTENDGLGFNWQPVELSEEELATVELQLKEESKSIGDFEKEEKKPIKVEDKQKENWFQAAKKTTNCGSSEGFPKAASGSGLFFREGFRKEES